MEESKLCPYEVKPLSDAERTIMRKHFSSNVEQYVRVGPKGYMLFGNSDHFASIHNFQLRSTDIFVASFPRSGTTWTQELVWLLSNDLDFDKARSIALPDRFTFMEARMYEKAYLIFTDEEKKALASSKTTLPVETSRRFLNTHLPLSLLPEDILDTAKMVYVARDPRDVIVSLYHFFSTYKLISLVADFKDFFEIFIKDLTLRTPYFEHVKEAWAQRRHPNMLFLFYEELSQDVRSVAKRVAKFLDQHYTEEQFDQLCEHLKFDNFQKNSAVNLDLRKNVIFKSPNEDNFIRKGKVGGWREYFDAEMTLRAEQWMQDQLQDVDLRFPTFTQRTS